ncbi:MAG: metallophosphoesterase [Bacteroidales bacterium]|jgi:predicted MPP superfamily phosphohydrolase|nr:metallophosphoesterase [Bacteroidales bacterium]
MKYSVMIIFLVVFLALITGAIIYLSNRFALFFPAIPKRSWLWGFSILLVATFASAMIFTTTTNPAGRYFSIFAGIVCSILIFLLLSVAITDLLSLLFKFSPQIRRDVSLGLTLLLTIYGVWNAYSIKVKEVTIPIKGLTKEIRAIHLTDVHLGNLRGEKTVERIVQKINKLNPDVVFNTGDMFDGKTHFSSKNDVLSAFRTMEVPHYFVYGNHDEHVGVSEVIMRMKNANINVLLNEIAYFGELQIIGLNNMLPDNTTFDPHTTDTSQTIEKALNKFIIKDMPTIVLHHRPDGVKYMQEKGVDLLLTGHTHAGQIFPFTLIAKLMFGYNRGLYKYEDMTIYVSQGIGTIFAPVRLGTRSEMTLIKLVPENN